MVLFCGSCNCRNVFTIVRGNISQVLEVNTLLGMSANRLLPKSAKAAGISFSQLLDKIIDYSLYERLNDQILEKNSENSYTNIFICDIL
ncbi:hypothetical protein KIK04_18060 [Paenibacillus sp. 481]|nr:hypothetical protein KIK04_18060 [Paenibacillus sp. 481]